MQKDFKHDLALGQWVFISNLPDNIDEQQIVEHFLKAGIQITEDHVGIATGKNNKQYAIVSIPGDEVAALVNWALNSTPLNGVPIVVNSAKRRTPETRRG